MSVNETEKIKAIFAELGLHPRYVEHVPVRTSQEAADVRGVALKQGIKSILFTNGKDDWAITDVPADKKVDDKKVAEEMGWSKNEIRMATPEEVIEVTGCEIGSVPPFGHKEKIQILFDSGIFENTESTYNIGQLTHSAIIPTEEMRAVFTHMRAKEGSFAK